VQTILAIETSCDETAATILRGCASVLGDVVFSQVALHAPHGGVVPEVASRSHLEAIPAVVGGVLEMAGLSPSDLDAFAATTGPGLAPALLVGASAARGLAAGAGKIFLPVNHLEGHLLSPFFGRESIPPHVGLVVSGGHTLLFDVAGYRDYRLLGRTLDDAAGEAFDKVAKLLGLGYPGGAAIERMARGGDPAAVHFPRGLADSPGYDFSFSGLKTSVRYFLEKNPSFPLADLCASFQAAVIDSLAGRLVKAARELERPLAALSGGVSSNAALAGELTARLAAEGVDLVAADPALRTDNARMIAYAAALQAASGRIDPDPGDVSPNFDPVRFV